MARCQILIGALALALPVAVEVPSPDHDSSETRISLAGGAGTYALVARGCEGEVLRADHVRFNDVGAAIEHRTASPLLLGLRAGLLAEPIGDRTPEDRQPPLALCFGGSPGERSDLFRRRLDRPRGRG